MKSKVFRIDPVGFRAGDTISITFLTNDGRKVELPPHKCSLPIDFDHVEILDLGNQICFIIKGTE